ncbi:MAG: hypothetical protein NTW87_31180 [Planctomycetota bacterium]|nr:hypothetical protein [Planctomycetota bacterium]
MRPAIVAVLLTALSLVGVAPAAEGDAKTKPAEGDAKAKPADGDAKSKAGGADAVEQTKTGTVGVKLPTVAADVVAVLYTMDVDYKLLATGDIAVKLGELAKLKTRVQVTGAITGDTMKVSQVVDLEHKMDDKKKDGGDKKNPGDKKDAGDRKRKKKDQN